MSGNVRILSGLVWIVS